MIIKLNQDAPKGPSIGISGDDGTPWIPPHALIRLSAGMLARIEPLVAGEWRVSAPGAPALACAVSDLGPGRYGEGRVRIAVRNEGREEAKLQFKPPFSEWADTPEQVKQADPQHFLLQDRHVTVGAIGTLSVHHPGIDLGSFVSVPAGQGRGYVCCVLHPGGAVSLQPGQTASWQLHVSGGQGSRHDALRQTYRERGGYLWDPGLYRFDRYQHPQLSWMKDITAVWFTWPWDKAVLDPRSGAYHLAKSIARARKQMGGYDVYILWPFWPRAGFDDRFQFDHYRDLPGGLQGLREEIRKVQRLGTRVITAYCVWSESDRVPPESWDQVKHHSYGELVEVANAIEADGVLMDLMSTTPEEILELSRAHGRELAPYNEGDPDYWMTQTNLLGRIHNDLPMPELNLKRYLLPHHPILRVCETGREHRMNRNNFVLSFFNGHGVEMATIWSETHPSLRDELPILARLLDLLRTHRSAFRSPDWDMLVESLDPQVWVNRWPDQSKTIYTLCGTDPAGHTGDLLRLPRDPDRHYVDLWRYRPLEPRTEGEWDVLTYTIEGFVPGQGSPRANGDYSPGCIGAFPKLLELSRDFEMLRIQLVGPVRGKTIEVWRDTVQPAASPVRLRAKGVVEVDLNCCFGHTNEALVVRLLDAEGQVLDVAVLPAELVRFFRLDRLRRTAPVDRAAPPEGMVRIPGGVFTYRIVPSQPMWVATYHSPPGDGHYQVEPPSPRREVKLAPFWIDRYPVTNAQYAAFVRATGYLQSPSTSPLLRQNFLKHFDLNRFEPMAGLEHHPVVYVSYDDAKAYAEWAGKRLPTEEEWQYAAGGADGRFYPWGNRLDPNCYNATGVGTTRVDAHPSGSSPFGVEDLVGNVWQWTLSLVDDGRYEMAYLRGGSWYDMNAGIWWVRGGPRRIDDHHPVPLSGPGMNRFSTVGFRCVQDE